MIVLSASDDQVNVVRESACFENPELSSKTARLQIAAKPLSAWARPKSNKQYETLTLFMSSGKTF